MNYSAELFQPHLNTPFLIQFQTGQQTRLLLDEIKNQTSENSPFYHFSLFFTGATDLPLAQGTYTLNHADLPAQTIFIVPVAKTDIGYRYQACFNITK
ncbi:DUF6916 family protein [Undibacterium rugosum]|uniref:DUF6916 family protein n=1 Tax=Undibacterium rugosum TaxID=2762291 RepID=UPI001B82AF00|nr:hypothetical protein [Undibacterium rugosum]MBR7780110.1 hypothetical protein [Undibacterium rugosum]